MAECRYAYMSAGSVEYSRSEAEVSIDDLLKQLNDAKLAGVTHVIGLSGNYRGAQYVKLGSVVTDEDEEEYL